jgi:anti-sigma regulatory factor (Ser/Thr protein kinase)
LRDLSLHVLDLIENSVAAGAGIVAVSVVEDTAGNRLDIAVEDDGPGLSVEAETALDPFYTTKRGKRTGLGLALFREAAERAGGRLTLGRSKLGGLAVMVSMVLDHIDRMPLGDLAATLACVVCTSPDVDLWCRLRVDDRESVVMVSDVARHLPNAERSGLAVARRFSERLRSDIEQLGVAP